MLKTSTLFTNSGDIVAATYTKIDSSFEELPKFGNSFEVYT